MQVTVAGVTDGTTNPPTDPPPPNGTTINGTEKNDTLTGRENVNDVIDGKGGHDTIRGLGAEITRMLTKAGATVAVADIDLERARAFAGKLETGGRCVAVRLDVRDEQSVIRRAVIALRANSKARWRSSQGAIQE